MSSRRRRPPRARRRPPGGLEGDQLDGNAEAPPELGRVPAGHGDPLAVGERELGGPAEQRAELDGAAQVGDVLPVNPDELVRLPAALDLAQRRAEQVPALRGDDPDEVAVRVDVQDRAA